MHYIYIVNRQGKPLMSTKRHDRIRWLLKNNLAVVINNNPFTIRLKYDTENHTQPLTLGIDPGRENIGLAVSNEHGDCVYQANVETKNKLIKKHMEERKGHRQARRRHKRIKKQRRAIRTNTTIQNGQSNTLRSNKNCKSKNISYPGMEKHITHKVCQGKEAKFNNRKRDEGWITPSARALVQTHINLVKLVQQILPITNIVIERNSFDFQKLENFNIKAWQYSKGPLYGFHDYKDYISSQQGDKCLLCGCNHIDRYHHIIYRSKGGSDTVANIAGLCTSCHAEVHSNTDYETELKNLKKGQYKQHQVSLLNSCMDVIIEELNNLLPVVITDGKTTKATRTKSSLVKDHCVDAYCISLVNTPKVGDVGNNVYHIKHFKKKNNNNIHQMGSRRYYYNGKLVAINRHKAFNQKEDSLEEYLTKYALKHSELETRQHFHQLEVKPAKRTYTSNKTHELKPFKPGDKAKYVKDGSVFIVESYRPSHKGVCYGTKEKSIKNCQLLSSHSLEYTV